MGSHIDEYSDEAFSKIIKESHTYSECFRKMGYRAISGSLFPKFKYRVKKLGISVEHFHNPHPRKLTSSMVFCENSTVSSHILRDWYVKASTCPYNCSVCGQEPFWNGKPMTLILDHINGFNHDNRIENLRWVCPNCNMQLDTTNGKNKNHGIRNNQYRFCVDCGLQIGIRSTRCRKCASEFVALNSVNPKRINNINKEELKNLIRVLPMTQVEEHYGVTDNAVRKWCKKLGLPHKASDIKLLTESDWDALK